MKTAKQIIIELINSKKINGEEAVILIESMKLEDKKCSDIIKINSDWDGITTIANPNTLVTYTTQ